jgi:hypothetical protein
VDPQCLLTEIAAKGLVKDQSPQIARDGAGPHDPDSWPFSERWPICTDPGDNAPCYPWEHTPASSLSLELSRRRRPLNAVLARALHGLRLARIMEG